ncbi:hypothetical protein BDK61_2863 [Haloarcula quadrata]|uniref:Uncharacterized protein n=1 Tax=Haloarcula quadrata TaxID=182779 RepID=A0A495R9E9_9EURY|nr:hypothetical protein [Haloarcula quadrata]RKS83478.1 hypothetical protein BDK61_2863 [Haloarcula quadrata]
MKASIAIMLVMLVTVGPVSYMMADSPFEPDHNGRSEAIAPAIVYGGALLAGGVTGGAVGWQVNDFLKPTQDQIRNELSDEYNTTIEEAANDTLRQAVHSNAIVSEGTNIGFLDNVDNDATTIEGQIEQRAGQAILREGNNVTSETELINIAEGAASEFGQVRQSNLIETHNFMALSAKEYHGQLVTAQYEQDIGAIDSFDVSSASEFSSISSSSDFMEIDVTDDIVANGSDITDIDGTRSALVPIDPVDKTVIVDLNDNKITLNGSGDPDALVTADASSGKSNIIVKNGQYIGEGASLVGHYADGTNAKVNVIDMTVSTSGGDYYDTNGGSIDVYNESTTYDAGDPRNRVSSAEFVDSKHDLLASPDPVTFSATEIANQNSRFDNASDVPMATFTQNNQTVSLPAINVSLDPSYMGENNTVRFATPYTADTGEPLVGPNGTGQTLAIKTPTSGVSDYAQPVDYARAYDQLTTTDDIMSESYSAVSSYASQQWSKYIADIASNESKTLADNENLSQDLGQLTTPAPEEPEQVTIQYTGLYEGTTLPSTDVIHVEEEDGDQYAGALFSTDMSALMEQTSSPDKVEEGDTFDVSVTNRTFIVSQDTGETNTLEGNVEVTLIEGKESADVREYGLERTDLGGQAQRLADQAEVTRKTVDDPGTVGVPTDPDNGLPFSPMILLVIAGAVVVLVVLND